MAVDATVTAATVTVTAGTVADAIGIVTAVDAAIVTVVDVIVTATVTETVVGIVTGEAAARPAEMPPSRCPSRPSSTTRCVPNWAISDPAVPTGRAVVAGPVEATAAGNILVQAAALGHVRGLAGIRQVVRDSFPVTTFQPRPSPAWEAALRRFRKLPRS